MVNSTMFRKEWRENAWKHILALVLLSGMGISLPFLFDWMSMIPIQFGGALGEAYQRQMSDFNLYMWANWYGKNLYQILIVYAVIVGMAQIAGEVGRNTAGFLFSKPLSRELIYRSKFISGAVTMNTVMIIATILTYLAAMLAGRELPALFLSGLMVNAAGLLVIYSLALMFSVMFDDQLKAGAATFLVALVISVPGWIPGYGMYSLYRQMHAWPIHSGDGFQIPAMAVMLLAAWLFYRIGLGRLLKKDL